MALQFHALSYGLVASFAYNATTVTQPFMLKGVNWFGFETETFSPHGLWSQSMDYLLGFLHDNKFNAIRVPFSVEFVEKMDTQIPLGIDISKNPFLHRKSCGEVLDVLVEKCKRKGILVMPDMHRMQSNGGIPPLWYDGAYTEARVIEAWKKLVARYKHDPYVFAVDLKNEPHGYARWGGMNPQLDWAKAAERIANEVLKVNPRLLVFVEGVEGRRDGTRTWWGGTLDGVISRQPKLRVPYKLVYSPHVYGPDVYMMPSFTKPDFPRNMPKIWTEDWGYLRTKKRGVVVIGEWGGRNIPGTLDARWHKAFADYLRNIGLACSTFYWTLNPNSADTGGLLQDDWKTPVLFKMDTLARLCPNPTRIPIKTGMLPVPIFPFATNISLLTPCDIAPASEWVACNNKILSFVSKLHLIESRKKE